MSVGARVISWNCCGARSPQFLWNARELIKTFRPSIFLILEPPISSSAADVVCRRLGRREWVRSEAKGFSGGIWVLWNREEVNLRVIHVEKHFVHMIVNEGKPTAWILTAVYASPQHHLRPPIWDSIVTIKRDAPWALMGDFNCTLKEGERNKTRGYSRQFLSWVNHMGLIDAGFSGLIFTWNHGHVLESRQSARLDRGLCDGEWRRTFPEASVIHLPHSHSDHSPILLQTSPYDSSETSRRPFRFFAA